MICPNRRTEGGLDINRKTGWASHTRHQGPISKRPTMTLSFEMASLIIRSAKVSTPISAAVATPKRSISGSRIGITSPTKRKQSKLFAPPANHCFQSQSRRRQPRRDKSRMQLHTCPRIDA
jgi:hypothetical protein